MAHQWGERALQACESIDRIVLDQLRLRATLIAAFIGLTFLIWAVVTQNGYLGSQVIVAGAIGYWLGFVPAVGGGLVLNALHVYMQGLPERHVFMMVIQLAGCSYIAWLGYVHKIATVARRKEVHEMKQRSHIVSWTVINEVRNSLLAVRLLLFSSRTVRVSPSDMRMVEDELVRLEAMLKDLPEKETKGRRETAFKTELTYKDNHR